MARPRKPPTPYQRRNARARALGYKSYYDYRIHGNGRIPPGRPVKGSRALLRGHGLDRWRRHGETAAMLRAIEPGVTISLTEPISQIKRSPKGNYPRIDKLLIGNDGLGTEYTIRNVSRKQLVALIKEETRRGGAFVAAPSFDQRRLVAEDEL